MKWHPLLLQAQHSSFCCDAWELATDKDGKEAEKVTAQQTRRARLTNLYIVESYFSTLLGGHLPETVATELLAAIGDGDGGGRREVLAMIGLEGVADTVVHLPLVQVAPVVTLLEHTAAVSVQAASKEFEQLVA